jgi:hypothetical protein
VIWTILIDAASPLSVEKEAKVGGPAQRWLTIDTHNPGLCATCGSLQTLPIPFRHQNAIGAAQAATREADKTVRVG